ncbi:hypothetical protein Dda_7399 [Drechslerella dactyloides]|uniref:Uncharacterized protein n=1 Tax=Drechslerella dactyloides TaxID=74499 RepID=A0AAD6ISI2_DREDA|nr:hypothetical protein Dda_7399 [Drechslerella dactyloides]
MAASLAAVRKTVFNPLLQTRDDVTAFLASQPAGTAHPFNRTLLLLEPSSSPSSSPTITNIDLADKDESYFLSATDLNSLSETITTRIDTFSAQLADFKAYTIISLTTPYLEVPFVPDEKAIIVLSVRQPTYYDFCVGNAAGDVVLYCNATHVGLPGARHSGDINIGNMLLHHVNFSNELSENPFGLFVSGYSYNSLHKYKPQNPAVTIADHHAKILYVVPVPLDEATIGDATLCIPVVGRRRGEKLCFSVLPSAVTSDQVAAGPKLPGDTLARAIAREPAAPPPPAASTPGATEKRDKKKTKLDDDDNESGPAPPETITLVDVDVAKPLFVTEEGCKLPSFVAGHDGNHITFFQGITVHASQPDPASATDKTIVLPCALGNPLEGSMVLALGTPFVGANVTHEQYTRLFDRASIVVFTVSDRMTDQARVLNPDVRCNALYILQTRTPPPEQATASVEDLLNDTKINAITALAGPQSVVVVQLGDRYYFYRGIRWAGLLDEIPKFGEDITEAVEAVLSQTPAKHPWSNITSIGDEPKVYFRGALCTPDELYTNFTSLQLPELEEFKLDVLDTLAQLQVALTPKDLPVFTSKLQKKLKEMMDATIAPHKQAYVDALLESKGQNRDPRLMEKYKRAEKNAKTAAQWLIDALGALVSSRISSTRKYDLKQMIRKQKILDNVAASKDMTYEDLATILEEHCTEIGMVIANIDTQNFRTLLQKAKENNVLHHLQQLTSPQPDTPSEALIVCKLDDRVQSLSGLDCGIILPLSQDGHNGPLATTTGKLALGFPYGISEDKAGSAFAFACFDQFINIKHPYSQFWVELCNVHHVSMLRILQRNTISAAVQSREFNIQPASKDLGFLLAYALTDAMRSLAATRSAVPPEARGGEDVDTTTKMMRGLFGYLMTLLAAGVQPMNMAWQLLSRTTTIEVPPSHEYWLYARIVELFPYTAWPRAQFAKNVRLLVARTVRKTVTDPVTRVLREGVSQIRQDAIREQLRRRNVALKWGEVMVEVLSRLLLGGYDAATVKEAAARIVGLVPAEEIDGRKGNRGAARVMRALDKLKETGEVDKVDTDTRLSAANTYAKRSALLKELKSRLVDAAVAGDVATAKGIYEEMQTKRRDVAALFGVDCVKLQNHRNIDAVLARLEKGEEIPQKEILRQLKSDAEIYRAPWTVGKPTADPPPPPSKIHLVEYILTGNMVEEPAPSDGTVAAAEMPKTLEQRLTALPGGEKAGKLAVVIEKVKDVKEFIKISGLPEGDFMAMLRYCNGRSGEEEVDVLKKVVTIFLTMWQDVVAAEKKVVEYLAGKKSGDEEKEIREAEEKAGVPKAQEEKKEESA